MKGWRILAIAAVLSGCGAPTLDELVPFACANNGLCPSGFACVENKCIKPTTDGSVVSDATGGDAHVTPDAGKDATVVDSPGDAADAADVPDVAEVADASDAADVSVDTMDSSAAGRVVVNPTSGLSINESGSGSSQTFTVVLDSAPASSVTIAASSTSPAEASVSPSSVAFTASDWSTPKIFTVTGVPDNTLDGNQTWKIQLDKAVSQDSRFNGFDPPDVTGTTVDSDVPRVVASPTSGQTSENAGTFPFTVRLNGPPAQTLTVSLTSSLPGEGTVSPSTLTFNASNYSSDQTVTVTGVQDNITDGNKSYAINMATSCSDSVWATPTVPTISMTSLDVPVLERASVSTAGVAGNGQSGGVSTTTSVTLGAPSVSSDGRYVAFSSEASNLGGTDTNSAADVFIFDRVGRTTTLMTSGTATGASSRPTISASGAFMIFHTLSSFASVVPGCVLMDTSSRATFQISTSTSCVPYDITSDGVFSVFTEPSGGNTLVKRYDKTSSSSTTVATVASCTAASISNDGRYISIVTTSTLDPADSNGKADLYVVDMNNLSAIPVRVSTTSAGAQLANGVTAGAMSNDGNYLSFTTTSVATSSDTDTDEDVYEVKRGDQTTVTLASRITTLAAGLAGTSELSTDGRYVVFEFAPPTAGYVKQIWVFDRLLSKATTAHSTYDSVAPNGATEYPAISGDGAWLAFEGRGTNMVANDTNGKYDIFVVPRP